jgi:hypothetical protein
MVLVTSQAMTPRQIIAQFKATLLAIAADTAVGSEERDQQMTGALTLASRLIRFHPQLCMKGATRSYIAELKDLLAIHSWHESSKPA